MQYKIDDNFMQKYNISTVDVRPTHSMLSNTSTYSKKSPKSYTSTGKRAKSALNILNMNLSGPILGSGIMTAKAGDHGHTNSSTNMMT